MRTLSSLAVLLLVTVGVGCSARGGGGTGRDGGGTIDGGGDGATDSTLPGRDTGVPPTDTGGFVDAACESTTPVGTTIIGDPPDILLVVDISGSMCTPLLDTFPPSMTTKLSIMKTALDNLVDGYDARINFGLMLFPGSGACGPGTIENDVAPRNAIPIKGTLSGLTTDFFGCAIAHPGATPTHISLDAARAYYGTIPVNPIGRYVLLATDGLPNCGPELPDGSTEETVDETVAAITALAGDGLDTYVLGFGTDLTGGSDALNRMATAGGTGVPYSATSATELATALDTIAAGIIPPSCTVELDGPVRDPALFQVSFDSGPLIPRDEGHSRGWDYDPATNTITFYGADCAEVQSGRVLSIDVDFGCPGPLI